MLFEKDGFILNSPMLCTMAKCEVYSEEERIVQMAHLTSIIIEINLFYSATSEEAVAFHTFPKAQETQTHWNILWPAFHSFAFRVLGFAALSFFGFPDKYQVY